MDDAVIRAAMFVHLDRLAAASPDGSVRSADINTFAVDGQALRLIVQTGIWKPSGLEAALTIRTTFTAPNEQPPYADDLGSDGLLRYKYRGTDPEHSDNRALRAAMVAARPLAYFVRVGRGLYVPRYPVWLVGEDRANHQFSVAVDEAQREIDLTATDLLVRDWVLRLTKSRLHQPIFRARVLRAYAESCSMCRLRHAELLDAAHILPDGHPRGDPVVPNGLSLCKIHHAAFDNNILGVRPDLVIQVQPKVLAEIDGPMLRHGLQEMAGSRLTIPRERNAQPDPERLEERYSEFQAAS